MNGRQANNSRCRGECATTGRHVHRLIWLLAQPLQHPLPSPLRCFKFGQAVGRAVASYPQALKVVILGSGGLSHQLDGERAGHINKEFDLLCMEAGALNLNRLDLPDQSERG